jgi:hypothetical protein
VVHEGLVEGLCQRRICDVCADNDVGEKGLSMGETHCLRTIMRRSYPTARDHKVILPNQTPTRFDSSNTCKDIASSE